MTPQEKQQLDEATRACDRLSTELRQFRQTIEKINLIDRFLLQKPLVLRNTNIRIEGLDGLKIGENPTDKLGFYGKSPLARQAAITAPTGGATIDAEARTAIGTIITVLKNLGFTA